MKFDLRKSLAVLIVLGVVGMLAGCGSTHASPAPNPAQVTLSPASLTYAAVAGDAPYTVTITATKGDGTADTFTVTSSNTSVATASASGNVVTITPVAAGTANIVITSGSDTTVTRTIVATISARAQLTLSPAGLTYTAVAGDDPHTVTVTATKGDGSADTFTVASSNTSVATVSASGNLVTITPVAAGSANIVITSGSDAKVSRTIVATISARAQLTLSPAGLTYTALAGDAPYTVTVTATKGDGTADTFTVTSSNTAVATATASGNVVTITPVAAGSANVVITSGSDAKVSRTIVATISAHAQLTLSPASLIYAAVVGNAPYQVTVTAKKGDGTNDTFTAESSNTAVVTASASGNVVTITAVGAGTANVVFTSGSEASVTKTIAATITVPVELTLSPASLTYSATAGDAPYEVTVTAKKNDGSADTFTVASSNTSVVTASASGNVVTITPVAAGNANVVFTSGSDSSIKRTIAATISEAPHAGLTLAPASLTYAALVGDTPHDVTVTATKADGSADTFTVESSNTSVVTATASGNVVTITPVAVGTASIIFTSGSDPNLKATIAATITVPVALTISPSSGTWAAAAGDGPRVVTVTATKGDGTVDTFNVQSSDTGVVSTSISGNQVTLTPVGAGTANVVFTSGSDSNLTRTIVATISVAGAFSGCDKTEYFCDDFQQGNSDNWDLTPNTVGTTPGAFSVIDEPSLPGNKVLKYTAGNAAPSPVNLGVIALIKDAVWNNVSNKSDYYIEARIMPLYNGTTSNKQLYLMGRYQDASNWYLAGLNCQSSTASTQIEEGWMKAGTISRGSQTKRPIYVPTSSDPDTAGQWHTVRLEMLGSTLTVYLDSEMMSGSKILTDAAFASGKIGLFTANKSFLIDDIRVGDANVKPSQLILTSILTSSAWAAEVGDAPLAVTVTALKPDLSADTFTVTSSNTNVVTTSVSGNVVSLSPVGVGTANIVFTSGSNPKLTRTITATITNSFVMPSATYDLTSKTVPATGDTAAYPDGKLVLTFDAPPTLGTAGSIRIFKSSDDSLIDVIKVKGDTDSIGAGWATQARGVSDTPVWVSGNKLVIAPHLSKLNYDTSYYVAIADGAVTGTLSGQNFTGIGKVGNWSFATKSAPASNLTTLTVDDDGTTADFRSVQGALNYVMKNVPTTTPATINVMDGTYQEMLFLRANNNITIKGQSRTGTIIQYNNFDGLNTGSGASAAGTPTSGGGRALFLVEGSDLLTLDTLTIKNTHMRSEVGSAQAETIYFNSDTGRLIAKNAEFWSEQDTLQLKGYTWFYNTLVAGNVDFIWGNNRVSLFENSEIRMVGDSSSATPSGGYYLQSRTLAGEKGFIFLNSSLTNGPGPNGNTVAPGSDPKPSYLARAAAGTWVDNILFINCKMDAHIAPVGWAPTSTGNPAPNPTTATALSGWREFGSMDIAGNPLDISQRLANSGQLTQTDFDANFASRAMMFSSFGGGSGWDPQP